MSSVVKTLRAPLTEAAAVPTAVDGEMFREAMSRIGAAVHIVTTAGTAGRAGATMTAVTSVSDAPPSLLVCINRTGRLNTVLRGNGVFCVNTLVSGDEDLAGIFAGKGGLDHEARFHHGQWSVGTLGTPMLAGARAVLECRVSEVSEVGSHTVVFGRVEAVHLGRKRPALLYVDRGYRSLPYIETTD
ncbi:MAG: flavin reductase [Siculibacillus sp.]|nr:flavin reductase [Siculibacillus sp.]